MVKLGKSKIEFKAPKEEAPKDKDLKDFENYDKDTLPKEKPIVQE